MIHPDYEMWQTPPEIFDPLMSEFNFDLDAAADEQTTRLPRYLRDSLDIDCPGERIWLNPPYGKKPCDSCVVVWNGVASFNFEPGDGSLTVCPRRLPITTRLRAV